MPQNDPCPYLPKIAVVVIIGQVGEEVSIDIVLTRLGTDRRTHLVNQGNIRIGGT